MQYINLYIIKNLFIYFYKVFVYINTEAICCIARRKANKF